MGPAVLHLHCPRGDRRDSAGDPPQQPDRVRNGCSALRRATDTCSHWSLSSTAARLDVSRPANMASWRRRLKDGRGRGRGAMRHFSTVRKSQTGRRRGARAGGKRKAARKPARKIVCSGERAEFRKSRLLALDTGSCRRLYEKYIYNTQKSRLFSNPAVKPPRGL